MLFQNPFSSTKVPVPVAEIRIESVGVNPLDGRRVDVAVDLTPCSQPVDVELVIVGPRDEELCSIRLVQNREWTLDKIMHLRQEPEVGEYTLHVGVFSGKQLVTRAERRFTFPLAEAV
jgi:hypothetical protein